MTPTCLRACLAVPSRLFPLFLLYLLAGRAAAAHPPSSTATATLANFHYTLIDLAPGDNLAPWLRLSDQTGDLSAGIYYDAGEYFVDTAERASGHGSLALAHRGNRAAGMADAAGVHATVDMQDRSGYAYMASIFSFSLSPWTRVVFFGDASTETELALDAQRSWAIAGLSGVFEDAFAGESALYSTLETSASGRSSAQLAVSGDALGGGAGGHLVLFANTLAWASAAPVPEPAAAALLGAGLIMVAGAVRRKGRSRTGGQRLAC